MYVDDDAVLVLKLYIAMKALRKIANSASCGLTAAEAIREIDSINDRRLRGESFI